MRRANGIFNVTRRGRSELSSYPTELRLTGRANGRWAGKILGNVEMRDDGATATRERKGSGEERGGEDQGNNEKRGNGEWR